MNSENALSAFRAMKEAGVPAALYMFDTGGHGFALRPPAGAAAAAWPKLFLDWLKALPAA